VFGLKDLLESPRPADCLKAAPSSLAINIRDYSGDIEDGLPSAHCSGSVALLFYCVEAAAQAGLLSSEAKLALQIAAAAWVAWIAFGRLYLAVHSPGEQRECGSCALLARSTKVQMDCWHVYACSTGGVESNGNMVFTCVCCMLSTSQSFLPAC
jgi:hypothetical protein